MHPSTLVRTFALPVAASLRSTLAHASCIAALAAASSGFGQDPFTIVVLPDTQNYVNSAVNAPIFTAQTQWIRDHIEAGNARNIAFVSQVGDVVSTATVLLEWQRAVASMNVLRTQDGFVVPYGILPGNHDYQTTSNKSTGIANYVANFGPQTFAGAPFFGGAEASGANTYQFFTVGTRTYLHLAMEWQPTANMPVRDPSPIEWAQSVIDAHPGLPVILSTHEYLDDVPPGRSAAGDALFNQLVRGNDQIFLVLNGHFHSGNQLNSGEYHQVSINNYGKPVVEILQDFQSLSNGGNGWLRLLEIDEAGDAINVETYSPWLDQFQTETVAEVGGYASQFSIALDFEARFQFVAPPAPPVEIYDETIVRQGLDGYAGTSDKEIRSSGGDAANGDNPSISVDGDDGSPGLQPNHGLFRFDDFVGAGPGRVPAGTIADAAFLEFDVIDPGSGFRAFAMTTPWTEATTWVALGGNGVTPGVECAPLPFFTIGADNSSANVPTGLLSIEATSLIQGWIDGTQPNFGVALIPFTNGTNGVDIATSESLSPPRLVVRSLKEGLELRAFQQGLDGYLGANDTQIREADPLTPQGAATVFSVDADDPNGTGSENQVLLRFAELEAPAGTIVRASLFLTASEAGTGGALHRMLLPWNDASTWAADFGGNGVQTDGIEAAIVPDAIAIGAAGVVEIDVTSAVRTVLDSGGSTIDWVIVPLGNDGWDFFSSDAALAARPRLTIVVDTVPAACVGDFDGDGSVLGSDLAVLLGAWGTANALADLTADGIVDGADLAVLLGAWGACPKG